MQNLPEVGKTYISKKEPDFSIYVEDVQIIEAEDGEAPGFCVEGCDPKDKGDMGAIGLELFSDEWHDLDLTPL